MGDPGADNAVQCNPLCPVGEIVSVGHRTIGGGIQYNTSVG